MKRFGGPVLFLDRNDINTDEIIPAKYLTENTKEALKPYCFEDLKVPGFEVRRDLAGKGAVVSRANFGCGSSREHAPWTLEQNGIHIVVAESFARIFRQNMYNCGMIAAEAGPEAIREIFALFSGEGALLSVDIEAGALEFRAGEKSKTLPLVLSEFEKALIAAGGWVDYAAKRY
ncbi:MAG: 3-isopropylmalate dehydratase small subunit [Spirochaetaceae bacterium]|jgi:3-isopropylmalate/(R)-2-methylmalate dehydratase small subunit|nr:3-isopropylmalate dehydratase small subunit [Spirochaetaceae bacterium]